MHPEQAFRTLGFTIWHSEHIHSPISTFAAIFSWKACFAIWSRDCATSENLGVFICCITLEILIIFDKSLLIGVPALQRRQFKRVTAFFTSQKVQSQNSIFRIGSQCTWRFFGADSYFLREDVNEPITGSLLGTLLFIEWCITTGIYPVLSFFASYHRPLTLTGVHRY